MKTILDVLQDWVVLSVEFRGPQPAEYCWVIAYEILLRFSALLWEDPMGAQQATASSAQGYI